MLTKGMRGLLDNIEPSFMEVTATRVLLAALLLLLCVFLDRVVGYLGRAGTRQEEPGDRRCTTAVLVTLVCTGFALRLPDLGGPALNWDEAMFAWGAASPTLADLWSNISVRSPHPPAYFLMLHGILEASWDPYWLRFPSVLAGTALIGAGYSFVKRLAGVPAGLAMATLVTFAPTLVELSRVARNYAFAFLLGVLAAATFVRYLQEDRTRDGVRFALLSAAGLLFHYCFLVVLAAQYVQLGATGLLARRPPSWWVRTALGQLPVLLVLVALYTFHIRQLAPSVTTNHQAMYSSMMTLSQTDLLAPIAGAWRYLAPLDVASACLVAQAVGLAWMLASRRFTAFLVCALPVVSAYVLSWTELYPFHGSRHSAYLFPYLFGPVAVLAAAACASATAARRNAAASTWPGRIGTVGVGLALACFVDSSMSEYHQAFFPVARSERVPEFLKYYRIGNTDRAFAILEAEARPQDVVLLTRQGLYEFRHHYRLRPAGAGQEGARPEANVLVDSAPTATTHLDVAGVRYYFSAPAGAFFQWLSAMTVVNAYEEIRKAYGLKGYGSLWVLRGGWDPSLSEAFRNQLPGTPFDQRVMMETNDVLLRVDGKDLALALAIRQNLLDQERVRKQAAERSAPQ